MLYYATTIQVTDVFLYMCVVLVFCKHILDKVRLYCPMGSAVTPDTADEITTESSHENVSIESPNAWLLSLEDSEITARTVTRIPLQKDLQSIF